MKEYLRKGFALNDDLLKQSGGGGYWHELLERIRDIRSSEKVFYRQIIEIYATSIDYDAKSPISIKESCTFKAKGFREIGETKTFTENIIYNKATARPIKMLQNINPQYTFDGPLTLIDGLQGSPNYRTGRWLGFTGNDFEAVIDLGAATDVSTLTLNTSVNRLDWVFDTRGVIISVSEDGKEYKELVNEKYDTMSESDEDRIYIHKYTFPASKARFVKVKALVEHCMPAWHGATGKGAFLFVDEIIIE